MSAVAGKVAKVVGLRDQQLGRGTDRNARARRAAPWRAEGNAVAENGSPDQVGTKVRKKAESRKQKAHLKSRKEVHYR